ncbi:MAG: hypothetical protein V4662_08545 [Verrucomicrobiota bacterium]
MRSILALTLAALLVVMPASALIQEAGIGIIYGANHVFSLTAPKGWMLDNESAVDQGLHAVFYPKGKDWQDSPVVAYARATTLSEKVKSVEDQVKITVAGFHRDGSPNYKAEKVKTITTDAGKEAVIYHFTGDEWGNSEAVAYFLEAKTINFIVMNSRKVADFEKALPAFEALAKSYKFMGDKPLEKKE